MGLGHKSGVARATKLWLKSTQQRRNHGMVWKLCASRIAGTGTAKKHLMTRRALGASDTILDSWCQKENILGSSLSRTSSIVIENCMLEKYNMHWSLRLCMLIINLKFYSNINTCNERVFA